MSSNLTSFKKAMLTEHIVFLQVLQRYDGFRIPRGDLPNTTREALGMPLRRQKKASEENAGLHEEPDESGFDFSDLDHEPLSPSESLPDEAWHDLSEADIAALRPESASSSRLTSSAPGTRNVRDMPNTVLLSDILPRLPPRGEFDIKQVGESSYFFS